MTERRRPVEEEPFVCLECGRRFPLKEPVSGRFSESLENHWEVEQHGPAAVQKAALERFRVGGNPTDDRFTDRT